MSAGPSPIPNSDNTFEVRVERLRDIRARLEQAARPLGVRASDGRLGPP